MLHFFYFQIFFLPFFCSELISDRHVTFVILQRADVKMVICLLKDSRKGGLNTTVNFMSGIMHDTSGLRALSNSKKKDIS